MWTVIGVITFILYLIDAIAVNNDGVSEKTKTNINIVGTVIVAIVILVAIGFFWYYFCGGIFAFEVAETFGDAFWYFVMSVFALLVIIATVVGIFKRF